MKSVRTIGIYLPRLDRESLLRFVEEDTKHWSDVAVPDLQAQGFLKGMSRDDVLSRANEIAEETTQELEGAALIELEIQDSTHTFDAVSIERAWEPTYLSADGSQLLEDSGASPATAQVYRVIFWVHGWNDETALTSSLGLIPLVSPSAMSERLWRLAPSVLVD